MLVILPIMMIVTDTAAAASGTRGHQRRRPRVWGVEVDWKDSALAAPGPCPSRCPNSRGPSSAVSHIPDRVAVSSIGSPNTLPRIASGRGGGSYFFTKSASSPQPTPDAGPSTHCVLVRDRAGRGRAHGGGRAPAHAEGGELQVARGICLLNEFAQRLAHPPPPPRAQSSNKTALWPRCVRGAGERT